MNRRRIWSSIACCLAFAGLGYAQQLPSTIPVYPSFQPALPTTLSSTPLNGPNLGTPAPAGPTLLPVTTIAPSQGYEYVIPASGQPKEIPKTVGPTPKEIPAAPMVPMTPVVPMNPVVPSTPMPPTMVIPPTTPGVFPGPITTSPIPHSTLPPTVISGQPISGQPIQGQPIHSGPIVATPMGNCNNGQCDAGSQGAFVSGPINYASSKHGCGWGLGCGLFSHLFDCNPCPTPLPCVWMSAEFLNWNMRGSTIPTLVISGPQGVAVPSNSPLAREEYGGRILGGLQTGVRARAGVWLDSTEGFGLDFGFIWLSDATENYTSDINSTRSLSRPIFNSLTNTNQVVIIDNDPAINGQISVASRSSFWGGEANTRQVFLNTGSFRLDGYLGYRYLNLTDEMDITQIRATQAGVVTSTFVDRFKTVNQFHGGQLGLIGEMNFGRLSIGVRGGAAVGFTFERTTIEGFSQVGATNFNNGVLTQSSNIGETTNNRFTVIPHAGGTVGFDLNKYMRVFGGYDLLIWTNPTRVGNVIDPTLNPTVVPGNGPVIGTPRPSNPNGTSTLWLHGWSAGVQFKW